MSPQKTKTQKQLRIVVLLMVFGSVMVISSIILDEKQANAEQFFNCAAFIDSVNIDNVDIDNLDVVVKYCMTFGIEETKNQIALHGLFN